MTWLLISSLKYHRFSGSARFMGIHQTCRNLGNCFLVQPAAGRNQGDLGRVTQLGKKGSWDKEKDL